MKSKTPLTSFAVPAGLGRTEGHLVRRYNSANKKDQAKRHEQLNLFRDVMTPLAKLHILAFMSLSDPHNLGILQEASMADIAKTMGFEPAAGGQIPGHVYEQIEEVGIRLRRRAINFFYKEITGRIKIKINKPGEPEKYRFKNITTARLLDINPLQTFGFAYEDEEGNPIDLDEYQEEDLVKYESDVDQGPAIYAIPLVDDKGNLVLKDDGRPRRKRANGVNWRWSTDFIRFSQNKPNQWIIYTKLLPILRKYLQRPAAFNLIFMTIFWNGSNIEMGHEALIDHLGITGKDKKQIGDSIDAAFKIAYDEGIIDPKEHRREPGYYKPSKKTGKERRKGMVYQWTKAPEWQSKNELPAGKDGDEAKPLTDKDFHETPNS